MSRQGSTIRFRYAGVSTQATEIVDAAGSSQLKVGYSWSGLRLADWSGSGTNPRYYGTNGHTDTTWVAGPTGAVTATVRYDPWGRIAASAGTMSEWRYQGSWVDGNTGLYWVVMRWYAPDLARFISEDDLLGTPVRPISRNLHAYGDCNPVTNRDTTGRATDNPYHYFSLDLYKPNRWTAWYYEMVAPGQGLCGGGDFSFLLRVEWSTLTSSYIYVTFVQARIRLLSALFGGSGADRRLRLPRF